MINADLKTVSPVKLTQYSHGAGCGCKISPKILNEILSHCRTTFCEPNLLVGNQTLDDAAVYEIENESVIISTTDFFMPIVDDPSDFGAIASVNAISDIYAMGGTPIMALAILCWPLDKLSSAIAGQVIEGARQACAKAGIPIAGGHSIDGPEPIFGLAVTGKAKKSQIRKNCTATKGCELYLTKELGVGILTTAQKRGVLLESDLNTARNLMLTLNEIGKELGNLDCVKAVTDVTGFGLMGHLIEMCEGSGLSARINLQDIPRIKNLEYYFAKETFPGGTFRNFASYGSKISPIEEEVKCLVCDPQTSGGLLIAVDPEGKKAFEELQLKYHLNLKPFGLLTEKSSLAVEIL